jgi:predicted  nucleic acid-binding Zn-ribbon protein
MNSVQVQCTRCKNVFRDHAGRLQDGYSRQCPSCEVVLFFAEDSPNPQVKLAMKRARKARKEQHESGVAKVSDMASASQSRAGLSRSFAGRTNATEDED